MKLLALVYLFVQVFAQEDDSAAACTCWLTTTECIDNNEDLSHLSYLCTVPTILTACTVIFVMIGVAALAVDCFLFKRKSEEKK